MGKQDKARRIYTTEFKAEAAGPYPNWQTQR
jgi:hypothetical protein